MREAILLGLVMVIAGACSDKQSGVKSESPEEVDFAEEIDAVDDIAPYDTVMTTQLSETPLLGDVTKIMRAFRSDSSDIYLSFTAVIPNRYPALSNYVADVAGSIYVDATDDSVAYPNVDSEASLVGLLDRIGNRFLTQVAPVYEGAMLPAFNIVVNSQPAMADDELVTYANFYNFFTGGAHGMSEYYYESVDPATGKALKFDQLVRPDMVNEFRRVLVDTISESRGVTPEAFLSSLNDFLMTEPGEEITVDNFPIYHIGLIRDSLIVVYPPYSIAPYSDGQSAYAIPAKGFTDF